MLSLQVIAYPQLNDADVQRIQDCRRLHNRLYHVIAPHFTLVFAVNDISREDFIAEVKKQLQGATAIDFTIRCAMVVPDAISGWYDAMLVPDEGFSLIQQLHDRLYSGLLASHLRLDIPYIPHMSIADKADAQEVKQICDEWNNINCEIKGRISELEIIEYKNPVLNTVERVVLK